MAGMLNFLAAWCFIYI